MSSLTSSAEKTYSIKFQRISKHLLQSVQLRKWTGLVRGFKIYKKICRSFITWNCRIITIKKSQKKLLSYSLKHQKVLLRILVRSKWRNHWVLTWIHHPTPLAYHFNMIWKMRVIWLHLKPQNSISKADLTHRHHSVQLITSNLTQATTLCTLLLF